MGKVCCLEGLSRQAAYLPGEVALQDEIEQQWIVFLNLEDHRCRLSIEQPKAPRLSLWEQGVSDDDNQRRFIRGEFHASSAGTVTSGDNTDTIGYLEGVLHPGEFIASGMDQCRAVAVGLSGAELDGGQPSHA